MSIATISASGVDRDTQPCRFDINARGIEKSGPDKKTIEPMVDRCVTAQPAKSESNWTFKCASKTSSVLAFHTYILYPEVLVT